jgi:NAD(P)-dependent dehydrogenase (short-subunit alcohol dehydrogenase family)
LALLDRHQENLDSIKKELGAEPANLLQGIVELTDSQAVERFAVQVASYFGRIDILVNVAGGFVYSGAVHEMNLTELDKMMDINLRTTFYLSAAVVRQMISQDSAGRIINISTRGALVGSAGMAAYGASKAGVLRLTESMAEELKETAITVNAVLPSIIDTPPNRKAMPQSDFSRWVSPESLADVIAFLASDSARDIRGASLPVYGRA